MESWDLSVFRYPPPSEKLRKTTVKDNVKTLELQFMDEGGKSKLAMSLKQPLMICRKEPLLGRAQITRKRKDS